MLYLILVFNFARTEATLDHFKINEGSAPSGFMHPVYMIRNITFGLLIILASLHWVFTDMKWYLYLATFLSCIFLYVPIHDGWYYVVRNRYKANSYPGGFFKGTDSYPANKFSKMLNEPTTRKLLLVWSIFLIIFIITYERF